MLEWEPDDGGVESRALFWPLLCEIDGIMESVCVGDAMIVVVVDELVDPCCCCRRIFIDATISETLCCRRSVCSDDLEQISLSSSTCWDES